MLVLGGARAFSKAAHRPPAAPWRFCRGRGRPSTPYPDPPSSSNRFSMSLERPSPPLFSTPHTSLRTPVHFPLSRASTLGLSFTKLGLTFYTSKPSRLRSGFPSFSSSLSLLLLCYPPTHCPQKGGKGKVCPPPPSRASRTELAHRLQARPALSKVPSPSRSPPPSPSPSELLQPGPSFLSPATPTSPHPRSSPLLGSVLGAPQDARRCAHAEDQHSTSARGDAFLPLRGLECGGRKQGAYPRNLKYYFCFNTLNTFNTRKHCCHANNHGCVVELTAKGTLIF